MKVEEKIDANFDTEDSNSEVENISEEDVDEDDSPTSADYPAGMNPDLPLHTDVNPFSGPAVVALCIIAFIFLTLVCIGGWKYLLARTSRTHDERERHR